MHIQNFFEKLDLRQKPYLHNHYSGLYSNLFGHSVETCCDATFSSDEQTGQTLILCHGKERAG
jgi:hypothetical protein